MNVSPATLGSAECPRLLAGPPPERVVLEVSDHDPVDDYDVLTAVLSPCGSAACGWPSTTSVPVSPRCATSF
ncbi:MAG TPA: hypothetical protein VIM19_11850 [Actinomycetes bacterium]